ncbi:MAG: alpha/beta fold hydrolase [Burkholderiaceae bacterium]|jgi:pimeloyl-[acyl-carrier protein] methyl ester esterase|nr:alpha/beta fold hydrolase [Burkholderiaceae bacterium]
MSTIVFWHGWGMGPGVWNDLTAQLHPLLSSRYKLIVQPLPGYTPAQEPAVYYSADRMLDDLMAELDEPVTLCGWSLGAMLAMLAAVRFPARVDKLILISATPNFMKRTDWPSGVALNMIDKLGAGIRVDPATALRRFITIVNQNDVNAREITRKLSEVTSAPIPVLESGLDLLKHTDFRPIVPDIRQPVLLLHGAHDTLMPSASAEWLRRHLPSARMAVLPGASHAPFLSDTEKCANLIADFMHDRV